MPKKILFVNKISKKNLISGVKRLMDSECNDGVWSFIVGSRNMSQEWDYNVGLYDISIKPIEGDDLTIKNIDLLNGVLSFRCDEFDRNIHKGVRWSIRKHE